MLYIYIKICTGRLADDINAKESCTNGFHDLSSVACQANINHARRTTTRRAHQPYFTTTTTCSMLRGVVPQHFNQSTVLAPHMTRWLSDSEICLLLLLICKHGTCRLKPMLSSPADPAVHACVITTSNLDMHDETLAAMRTQQL